RRNCSLSLPFLGAFGSWTSQRSNLKRIPRKLWAYRSSPQNLLNTCGACPLAKGRYGRTRDGRATLSCPPHIKAKTWMDAVFTDRKESAGLTAAVEVTRVVRFKPVS